jgi:5'-nucleotidase
LTAVRDDGRVVVRPRRLEGLDKVSVYAVGATPAYIVLIALRGAFGDPPELVLSGINAGHNVGQAVLHSGTVGAVMTAASQGCRGLAVSVAAAGAPRWETAAAATGNLLPWLIDAPARTVLNVNAPDLPADQVRGGQLASLASFGAVRMSVTDRGKKYVRIQQVVDKAAEREQGTDAALLATGWVTVTPLTPICEPAAAQRGLAAAVSAVAATTQVEPAPGADRDG